MYYFKMKRKNLKEILLKYYSKFTADSILSGRRRPSIEKRIALNQEHNIPILAWQDIKSYISEQNSKNSEKGNK